MDDVSGRRTDATFARKCLQDYHQKRARLPKAVSPAAAKPPSLSNWQNVGVLDILHHRVGVRFAHARQVQDYLGQKLPVMGHVAHAAFDEIIKAACDHVAFQHFGRAGHR